ncbi:hypothetical protein BC830DRAFT_1085924 [Chytriomyces sp. MP71]|nr:hypothetical protein BC830DRAFT_1085924 [Chytriomyces sp. MP71]
MAPFAPYPPPQTQSWAQDQQPQPPQKYHQGDNEGQWHNNLASPIIKSETTQQAHGHSSTEQASSSSNTAQKLEKNAQSLLANIVSNYQSEIAKLTTRPLPCECCRRQKKKCDRLRPACSSCADRRIPCEYVLPPNKASQAKWRARLALENRLGALGVTPDDLVAIQVQQTRQGSGTVEDGSWSSEDGSV